MLDDVTVVIPTLNEAEGIVKVLEELRGIGASNVLVVDGGSTDGTAELARRMGARVIFQEGRGKADAVKTALRRVETPYVVVMDGDFTYPAEHVKDIVAKLREGYDEVIGARRYVEPGAMSRLFAFGNKVLTWWFNLLFGTHLTDVLSGMYGLRREAVADALFATRGFSVEVEIAAHVASAGEIAEVPIRYRRRVGKKKLKMHHGLQIALDAFRLSWLYNPLFLLGSLGALLLAPGVLLALGRIQVDIPRRQALRMGHNILLPNGRRHSLGLGGGPLAIHKAHGEKTHQSHPLLLRTHRRLAADTAEVKRNQPGGPRRGRREARATGASSLP
ncbi:MAG: glycosyltransferase family 2 protein [Thermoproteus sp.]